MSKREVTCITCPIGCRILSEFSGDEFICIGNKCRKGKEFAFTEQMSPVRTLTTTVRTSFPYMPVLSVKTKGEVPKEKIFPIMRELSCIMITGKIIIGETVVENILNTGCDIIATGSL
ncbi:MAG: DUF1667 domain-containing protein [Treponema sp.]|nr:DUF1667 domain-containing protein [Treponema sp.]MCL2272669.1 DUF1667 domain-containing protein [Treponema sp.]